MGSESNSRRYDSSREGGTGDGADSYSDYDIVVKTAVILLVVM